MKKITNPLVGKTIIWSWTEGAFAGDKYELTFFTDGRIHWKGLKGSEKGKEGTDKEYRIVEVNNDIHMLSWLEEVGYTVTATLNLKENTIFGFVSNEKEWYPLIGVIHSIK